MHLGRTIRYIPFRIKSSTKKECIVEVEWDREQSIDPELFLFEASTKVWDPTSMHACHLIVGKDYFQSKPLFDESLLENELFIVRWRNCYDRKGSYPIEKLNDKKVLWILKDPYSSILNANWSKPLRDGECLNIAVFWRINMDKWNRIKWARDKNHDPRSVWLQLDNINSVKRLVFHLAAAPGGIPAYEWLSEIENGFQKTGFKGIILKLS